MEPLSSIFVPTGRPIKKAKVSNCWFKGVCSEEFKKRFGKSLEERIGVKDGLFFEWSKKHLARSYKKDGKTFYALNERGLMLLNLFLESLL